MSVKNQPAAAPNPLCTWALRVWAQGKQQLAAEVTVAKAADASELEAFVNEVMHEGDLPVTPEDGVPPTPPDPLFHTHPQQMLRWRQLLIKMQQGTATHADNIEAERLSAVLFPEEHAQSLRADAWLSRWQADRRQP